MHLYIMTRGIKTFSDQFITELQGKYVRGTWPDVNDPKKLNNVNVQVAVRPIQLYEIVFPEESKDVVLTTILGKNRGKTQHKKHSKFVWMIRKMLGVEEIPEYNTNIEMPITKMNLEIIGIGIKKDYWQNVKTEERADHKINEDYFEGL